MAWAWWPLIVCECFFRLFVFRFASAHFVSIVFPFRLNSIECIQLFPNWFIEFQLDCATSCHDIIFLMLIPLIALLQRAIFFFDRTRNVNAQQKPVLAHQTNLNGISFIRWRGKPQPQIPPTHLPSLQFQLRLLSNSGGQWDYQNTVVDPPLSKGPRTEIVNISKMTCKLNIFQLQLIVNCANGFTFTPNDDVSHTHTSTQSQCHSNDINVMMELNHNDLWCAFSQWLDLKIVLCGRSQFTLSFSSFSSSAYNGSVDSLEAGKSGICS